MTKGTPVKKGEITITVRDGTTPGMPDRLLSPEEEIGMVIWGLLEDPERFTGDPPPPLLKSARIIERWEFSTYTEVTVAISEEELNKVEEWYASWLFG